MPLKTIATKSRFKLKVDKTHWNKLYMYILKLNYA
jgi:hypothetical protein